MKEMLNDSQLEEVVGGTVRFNGNKMKIAFTVTGGVYNLKNCEDSDVLVLVSTLYGQYKDAGDRAYENAVKAALQSNGWI